MTDLANDRFLRALAKQPVDRTPVWMMRQAGRYLPEYRASRAHAGSFLDLCKNADFACEVTLQPLARYPLDAAILFSDILTVPDALGLGLYFEEGEGPRFQKPIVTEQDIANLRAINTERDLPYVLNAVKTIRSALAGQVPLIGFSGSPWTLATYMVEGRSSRDFAKVKNLAYSNSDAMHQLLDVLVASVTDYLNAQILAGAQAVQIFDTWGGVLSHDAYLSFSLNPMKKIVDGLIKEHEGRPVPVIVFTKGGGQWLEAMADIGATCLGLDWTTDIGEARKRVGDKVALQGNMDPAILRTSPDRIRAEVQKILSAYGSGSGHVFNLGHGITPDVPPENAGAFITAVQKFSENYHSS